MPVKNAYEEVIAVAQVINKNPDIDNGQFTEKDEQVTHKLTRKEV
jgi:dual 3',5'-cyclic-AMP and -GMP phosphodiesterase 11